MDVWHTPGMAATSGDDKKEPQLELPTLKLPRFGRSRKGRPGSGPTSPEPPEPPAATAPPTSPRPLPAPEPSAVADPEAGRAPAPRTVATEPAAPEAATTGSAAGGRRAKPAGPRFRAPTVPAVAGPVAAGLTGVVVGLGGAAATYAAMAGCEAVRGVSTCGGGPGFFILVAIVVLMVLAGGLLLRLLGVPGPVGTSFLAVGVVTVLTMLLLLDVIFSPWMFLVVPVLSAAAYLLAHWVTTRFEHEDVGRRDWR